MTTRLSSPPAARLVSRSQPDLAWVGFVLLSAVFYGWIVFGVLLQSGAQHFGWSLYDEAFLALAAGELNVPARALGLEGHFRPDGTGYLYHGLAPLLTRLLAAPFVDLSITPLAPFSIWIWAVIGTAAYHRAFLMAARSVWPADGRNPEFWFVALGLAVWVGGPGLLLSSNLSLYQEPIAVAYAATGGVVWLWTRAALGHTSIKNVLIVMALLTAVCVHARPHVAVGLYLIVVLASLWSLKQNARATLLPTGVALVLLAMGGGSYLGYNTLRFADATTTHGTFEDSEVQHAVTFWGVDNPDSAGASAFVEHGRFNIRRVLPNGAFYLMQPPQALMPGVQSDAVRMHSAATQDAVGKIRIESPGAGLLALWTVWIVLAANAFVARRQTARPYAGLLLGTGAAALILCAYATITLRYHIDLWPFIAALALVGILKITPIIASHSPLRARGTLVIAAGLLGVTVNGTTANVYTSNFAKPAGGVWTYDTCAGFAEAKGFSTPRIGEICRAPRVLYTLREN